MNENKLPVSQSPVSDSVHEIWDEMKSFAQREPLTAVAAVVTVGLLLKLLPNRWLVTTGTVIGGALIRPAILSLALTQVMQRYFPETPRSPES
jgi:hypothetical protein